MHCSFVSPDLIIHVFCFSIRAPFLGVGYAALPVFMLLVWVIALIFKGEIKASKVLGVSFKRGISWVVLFYGTLFRSSFTGNPLPSLT
jgi:hypothetical protein